MSWREDAACRGVDLALFFAPAQEAGRQAKRHCAGCPVRVACLVDSLRAIPVPGDLPTEPSGIFGGAGGATRRELGRLDHPHEGYDLDCACEFCDGVRRHFARLDGDDVARVVSFGPDASHGLAATYNKGCRCQPCKRAKAEDGRARRARTGAAA